MTRVIAVGGEFDGLVGQTELTEVLDRCVETRRHVLLDLSETQFIDSVGLSLLVSAHRHLREVDRGLVVMRPRPHVARILAIVGLTGLLPIASNEVEARRLLERSGGADRPLQAFN